MQNITTLVTGKPSSNLEIISPSEVILYPKVGDTYMPLTIVQKENRLKFSLFEEEEKSTTIFDVINGKAECKQNFEFSVEDLSRIFSSTSEENIFTLIEIFYNYNLDGYEEKFVEVLSILKRKYSIDYILNELSTFPVNKFYELFDNEEREEDEEECGENNEASEEEAIDIFSWFEE